MAENEKISTIKSLDGTLQRVDLDPNKVTKSELNETLPLRPQKGNSVSSKDSLPPPGHQLTGKQEHCGFQMCISPEYDGNWS